MVRNQRAILIVDDNTQDSKLSEIAFRKSGARGQLTRVSDGQELMDYLHRRGRFHNEADAPTPALILLDLEMPNMDGRKALTELRSTPSLRQIPIVVMTNSRDPVAIRECYTLGANAYAVKPQEFKDFVETFRRIEMFWLETAELPEP